MDDQLIDIDLHVMFFYLAVYLLFVTSNYAIFPSV